MRPFLKRLIRILIGLVALILLWLAWLLPDEALKPAPDLELELPALSEPENGLQILRTTSPGFSIMSHVRQAAKAHLISAGKFDPLLVAPMLPPADGMRAALEKALQHSRWAMHGDPNWLEVWRVFEILTADAVMDAHAGRWQDAMTTAHQMLDALECLTRGAAHADPSIHAYGFFNSCNQLGLMDRVLRYVSIIFLHCAGSDSLTAKALQRFLHRVDEVTRWEMLLSDLLRCAGDVHRRFLTDPDLSRHEKLGEGWPPTPLFLPVATANLLADELRRKLKLVADWQNGRITGHELEAAMLNSFNPSDGAFDFLLRNQGGNAGLWSNTNEEAFRLHGAARVQLAELRAHLMIAVAHKLYVMKHGYAPETLADLAPGFLKEIPSDPWDGAAINYSAGLIRSNRTWRGRTPATPAQCKDLLGFDYMRLPN